MKKIAIPTNIPIDEIRRRTFETIAQIRMHGAQNRKSSAITPETKPIPRNANTARCHPESNIQIGKIQIGKI
jgi:hypothetical protein